MPRQARLDTPGTLHHVIVRGIEKRRIVDDQKDRADFVSRVGRIASDTGTVIYAWALLTNHAHILLRSGNYGLPSFMRKLLTGYAIYYNRRHKRHGHLFQNRYKSIVCEEESYFTELVRYIHLNPLRAGMVKGMAALDRYRWCGHGVLIKKSKSDWQDSDYVLGCFGRTEDAAITAYRQYVTEGVAQGRRPELVGGGLIRSLGGWSEVKALRKLGKMESSDERILGSSDFVEKLIQEAESSVRRQFPDKELNKQIDRVIKEICADEKVGKAALQSGSRMPSVVKTRKKIMQKLVGELGVSLAETARCLGVSTSAISKSLMREGKRESQQSQ